MNIEDLTINQVNELKAMFSNSTQAKPFPFIGKKVIVRTYSAGVHYGELVEKEEHEVILKNSRRLWHWKAAQSISLSGVAVHGIDQNDSKISPAVPFIWLEAIEIIPCSDRAIKAIEGAEDVKAR